MARNSSRRTRLWLVPCLIVAYGFTSCVPPREPDAIAPVPWRSFDLDSGRIVRAIIRDSGLTPVQGRLLGNISEHSPFLPLCTTADCDSLGIVVVPMSDVRMLEVRGTGAPRLGRMGFYLGMIAGLSIGQRGDENSNASALLMFGGAFAGAAVGALAGAPFRDWYPVIPPCTRPHGC